MTRVEWQQLAPPTDPIALDRVKDALKPELENTQSSEWSKDLLLLALSTTGLTVVLAIGAFTLGGWELDMIPTRFFTLVPVLLIQLLAMVSCVAPRATRLGQFTVFLAPITFLLMVMLRPESEPTMNHPWVCSVSHFALAVLPLLIGFRVLAHAAISPWRAISAGLAAGSVGALLGELACGQGSTHIAMFHVPAWIFTAAIAYFVSRQIRPKSYAP